MKHHSQAFTLIEVLIGLFILATTGYVLTSVQMRSFLRVKKHRESINRAFSLKKELYQLLMHPPEQEKPVVFQPDGSNLRIVSQMVEIPKKSSLYPFQESLRIIKSEADWKDFDFVRREKMICFIYKEPEKEDEKKK